MNSYIFLGLIGLIAIPTTATGIYLLSRSKTEYIQDNLEKSIVSNHNNSQEPQISEDQLKYPSVKTNLLSASKAQTNTIGSRFEEYLLNDVDDKEWENKVKGWVKSFLSNDKNKLTSEFITASAGSVKNKTEYSWMSITTLQSRCKKAYSKTDWKNDFGSNNSINSDDYWNTVKELCGKPNTSFPNNWNPNK